MRLTLLGLLGLTMVCSMAQADGPYQFYPLTPCRVVDTRYGNAPYLSAGTIRNFAIINASNCGVPSTARAAVLNVTAIDASNGGDLRIFPYLASVPPTSVINFPDWTVDYAIANGAIVSLANIGGLDVSVQNDMPSGGVQLVLDVTGYFK